MKRFIHILLCIGLGAILLFGAIGCGGDTTDPGVEPTGPVSSEDTVDPVPDTTDANLQSPSIPDQTEGTTPGQTPGPTPEPTSEPKPTRAPIEGDVSVDRFPNYDTGSDADWSYQSDELRIAIKRIEDEDEIIYYVADIWIRNINSLRMGFGYGAFNSGREEPEVFAAREHAIFAVNGTMNSGLVIHNGEQVKKNIDDSSMEFRSGIVIIYRDGTVKLIDRTQKETYKYSEENGKHGGIWQALQFGPVLVRNGEVMPKLNKSSRRGRTVFGYCEPGHYIIAATSDDIHGRVTMQEMAELMASFGCVDAINLDGGQSSAMVFMGQRITANPNSDRKVNDMILFAEYDADGNAPDLSEITPNKMYGE